MVDQSLNDASLDAAILAYCKATGLNPDIYPALRDAIRQAVEAYRQHQAEQSQDMVERVVHAITPCLPAEVEGNIYSAAEAAIIAMGGVQADAESLPQRVADKDDNLAPPYPVCRGYPVDKDPRQDCPWKCKQGDPKCLCANQRKISVDEDTSETIRHGLDCAEIFLLKHCHQQNAATILNAVIEARAALLSAHKPVMVDLEAGVKAIQSIKTSEARWSYDQAKACAKAWRLKYVD